MMNSREFRKFMREVLYYPMWNDVEVDTWRQACEYAGIQYDDYCDPDELFADLCAAQMNKDKK